MTKALIRTIFERKNRQVSISKGRTVECGSEDHISDLSSRIEEATYWRDRHPRGSAKRSHYSVIVSQLKNELQTARRHSQRLNEKQRIKEEIHKTHSSGHGLLRRTIRMIIENAVEEQQPKDETMPAMQLNTSGVFVEWPDFVLSVPYEASSGVGPGEYRLKEILGPEAKVEGQSSPYDISTKSGNWEVKEPDRSALIRAGTEGVSASKESRDAVEEASDQVLTAYSLIKKPEYSSFYDSLSAEEIDKLESFIKKDVPEIKKANIVTNRVKRLIDISKILSRLAKEEIPARDTDQKPAKKYVEIGDEKKNVRKPVDLKTYLSVGQQIGLAEDEFDISAKEVLAANLKDKIFTEPEEWFQKNWTAGCLPSKVFGHTNGVILVSLDGYQVILSKDINEKMDFYGVTNARARYRVRDWTGVADTESNTEKVYLE